jgi:hypothetical protein
LQAKLFRASLKRTHSIKQRNLDNAPTIWPNIRAGNGIFRRGDRRLDTA